GLPRTVSRSRDSRDGPGRRTAIRDADADGRPMTGCLLALALQVVPTISPPPGIAGSTMTAPPRITISGRVLGADGRPSRPAQVRTFSVEPPLIGAVTATDDDGRYEFALPIGEYTMSASRVGYLALQYGQRRPTDKGEHVRV